MVYESLGKELVVQGKDMSPLEHPTQDNLHCCLIVFPSCISITGLFLRFKVNFSS